MSHRIKPSKKSGTVPFSIRLFNPSLIWVPNPAYKDHKCCVCHRYADFYKGTVSIKELKARGISFDDIKYGRVNISDLMKLDTFKALPYCDKHYREMIVKPEEKFGLKNDYLGELIPE